VSRGDNVPIKLNLENQTCWDTRALRKIILRGIKAEAGEKEYSIQNRWSVTVKYLPKHSLRYAVGGYAWLGSTVFAIKLPHPEGRHIRDFTVKRLAQVITHEVHHCLGLTHKDMRCSWQLEVAWLEPPLQAAKISMNMAIISHCDFFIDSQGVLVRLLSLVQKQCRFYLSSLEWKSHLLIFNTLII